jgi:hypothetical protein
MDYIKELSEEEGKVTPEGLGSWLNEPNKTKKGKP